MGILGALDPYRHQVSDPLDFAFSSQLAAGYPQGKDHTHNHDPHLDSDDESLDFGLAHPPKRRANDKEKQQVEERTPEKISLM